MLEVRCSRCRDSHSVLVDWSEDKGGRARISYVCPVKGSRVSAYPPRGASPPSQKGVAVARTTRKTGTTPQSLRVSIPLAVEADPDIAAAWDIAEGLLDGLAMMSGGGLGSIEREAAAAFARAKGESSEADTTEHAFGKALAEALRLVAVHRRMSAQEWSALAPTSLGAASSPGRVLPPGTPISASVLGTSGPLSPAGAASLPGLDLSEGIGRSAAGVAGAGVGAAFGVPAPLGTLGGQLAFDVVTGLTE